jgi:hypothetical protein
MHSASLAAKKGRLARDQTDEAPTLFVSSDSAYNLAIIFATQLAGTRQY